MCDCEKVNYSLEAQFAHLGINSILSSHFRLFSGLAQEIHKQKSFDELQYFGDVVLEGY